MRRWVVARERPAGDATVSVSLWVATDWQPLGSAWRFQPRIQHLPCQLLCLPYLPLTLIIFDGIISAITQRLMKAPSSSFF